MYSRLSRVVIGILLFLNILSVLVLHELHTSDSANISRLEEEKNILLEENSSLRAELSQQEELLKSKDSLIEELREELSNSVINNVYVEEDFKSYMDYRRVTDSSSPQYTLLKRATPDSNGLMTIEGYYCIATGSAYGEVGDILLVTLDSGSKFYAIKSDEKKDIHTIDGKVDATNSSVVEFIVDTDLLARSVKLSGSVSSLKEFSSKVVSIESI